MISDCQVSYSFVSNSDFSLHWINFRKVSNRLERIEVKQLVSKQLYQINRTLFEMADEQPSCRVVYKSWQPAKFAGFSASFHRLLSSLHESRYMYVEEMMFMKSHNHLLFTKLRLLINLKKTCCQVSMLLSQDIGTPDMASDWLFLNSIIMIINGIRITIKSCQ